MVNVVQCWTCKLLFTPSHLWYVHGCHGRCQAHNLVICQGNHMTISQLAAGSLGRCKTERKRAFNLHRDVIDPTSEL